MDDFFTQAYEEANPEVDNQEVVTEPVVEETVEPEVVTEPDTPAEPEKIKIEGLGEFTFDELKEMQQGYMRQSDYTRKTQELARLRKESENIGATPMQPSLNPYEERIVSLEQRIADRELDETLTALKTKYPDFDEVKVLNEAYERGTTDLDFVYHALRPTQDATAMRETMKAELRAEIMREIETNKTATGTIISQGGVAVQSNPPQYTDRERYIAEEMGMTVEEYLEYK